MLDIGWSELFVIGIVALVVIGPKDMPVMFRTLGRFTAKARNMARDFQRAMDSAADETGVKNVARDLKSMTSAQSLGLDAMQNAAQRFEKWDPLKRPAPTVTGAGVGAAAAAVVPAAKPVVAVPAAGAEPAAIAGGGVDVAPNAATAAADPVILPPVAASRGPATAALTEKRSAASAALKARVPTPPLPVAEAEKPAKRNRKAGVGDDIALQALAKTAKQPAAGADTATRAAPAEKTRRPRKSAAGTAAEQAAGPAQAGSAQSGPAQANSGKGDA